MLAPTLLACRVYAESSTVSLMGFLLWVTQPFSLAALSIFSLFQHWESIMCIGVPFLRISLWFFSVFPGFECWPALLGLESSPG